VGAALAIGAWALLLRSGFAAVRRRSTASGRLLAAALLGAGVAYTVHALYDWDWDIPGVTLPALILLGVLAGAAGFGGGLGAVAFEATGGRSALSPGVARGPGPASRMLAAATAALAMAALGLSSVLPSLASGRAATALLTASASSPAALPRAQHDAAVAASLDPLSDAGPSAQAFIAAHQGDLARVRPYLLQALVRDPSDEDVWARLAVVDVESGHPQAALTAADRLFELDPFNRRMVVDAVTVAQEAELRLAPPRASATAIATP
jgi:tetratricopeptide (TPR) repeat protein